MCGGEEGHARGCCGPLINPSGAADAALLEEFFTMTDETNTQRKTLTLLRDPASASGGGAVQASAPAALQGHAGGLVQPEAGSEPRQPPTQQAAVEPTRQEPVETSFVDVLGSEEPPPVADESEPEAGSAPGHAPSEPMEVGPLEIFGRSKRARIFRR
jgi:hypothetical protein